MILADGATLQNGKYVIHAVLHRTDLGVTYQAYHVYLDQTVVLQTLNPTAQRFSDAQVRQQTVQQFMEAARQLAKYPSNHRLRAIDLFQEQVEAQDIPFVVLSFFPDQPPQKLGEWFTNLPEPSPPESLPETVAQTASQAVIQTPEPASIAPAASHPAPAQAAMQAASSTNGATNGTNGAAPVEVSPAATATQSKPVVETVAATRAVSEIRQPTQILKGRSPYSQGSSPVRVLVQPKRRLPNAFLLTALIAGAAGAGMGLALRVQPTPEGRVPFSLGTRLFTREQSFPPQGNWPIYEMPAVNLPEPADSQPAYSAEPALQYTPPPIAPFPAGSYTPPPAAPVQPAPEVAAPEEPVQSTPIEAAPEIDRSIDFPPANSAPPISREPAPLQPAPIAPAVTEPPPVAPPPVTAPAPEPLPVRPPRPKAIDQ